MTVNSANHVCTARNSRVDDGIVVRVLHDNAWSFCRHHNVGERFEVLKMLRDIFITQTIESLQTRIPERSPDFIQNKLGEN